jgi:putative protease
MLSMANTRNRSLELVAPAGDIESAYAAFHFGADAVYLGLKRFSARAEAVNLDLDQVDHLTAYARSLVPARRVYVALNTLVQNRELPALVETVGGLNEIGVDAIIVQDLGVYRLVHDHFPAIPVHASTQMAVHNVQGVRTLARLGFRRVVLARELTLDEIRACAAVDGIDVECFIHGALCYSYSGLCLFSSMILGRSGNRGQCAHVCRNSYVARPGAVGDLERGEEAARIGMPFSMKDLALPDRVDELAASGVAAFKIEGRRKSALYVAAATRLYRGLVDGGLPAKERATRLEDLRTVFSRPLTELSIDGVRRTGIADADTAGPRGAAVGVVESVVIRVGQGGAYVRFKTSRRLELRDGLQIDLPELYKPFGFAVERLRLIPASRRGKPRDVCEVPPGSVVEVGLPDEPPSIPPGATIYCSSSQEVKQRLRYEKPHSDQHRTRRRADFTIVLTPAGLSVVASFPGTSAAAKRTEVRYDLEGAYEPAKKPAQTQAAARTAFAKLGDTRFAPGEITVRNESARFVPVSVLNEARRQTVALLEAALDEAASTAIQKAQAAALPPPYERDERGETLWSVKVERAESLDAFEDEDLAPLSEVVLDVGAYCAAELVPAVERLAGRVGAERVRLALPAVTRSWDLPSLTRAIDDVFARGYRKWEAANLSAWSLPGFEGASFADTAEGVDLTTDWSIYVLNRLAAAQAIAMGATRFVLSPEDDIENIASLVGEFGRRATLIVYQDTPLFVSESCPRANLTGTCDGEPDSCGEPIEFASTFGEKILTIARGCRTVTIAQKPFSISHEVSNVLRAGSPLLRAEFRFRAYTPVEVRDLMRAVRAGERLASTHEGNAVRGLARH